jgi:hypothetical protein
MHLSRRILPLLLLAAATSASAAARDACMPVVSGAWVRLMPMMPMGAGFFSLRNPCRADVVLSGVESTRFGEASMHETRLEAGVSRMRPLSRVVVHPGETIEFRPGGRHLMLMAPDAKVARGTRVRIVLRFDDGRRIPVEFDVRGVAP